MAEDIYIGAPDVAQKTWGRVLKMAGDEESRAVTFRASTPTRDRHDSIVMPEGIQTANFEKNPIFGWGHDVYDSSSMSSIIGKVTGFHRSAESFDVDVEFAPADVNPAGEMALRMVRGEYLSMVSIGFMPIDAGFEVVDESEVFIYRRVDLLEVSLVPIPANPEAEVIRNAIQQKYLNGPPSHEADSGLEALKAARVDLEIRRAFARWIKE